MALTRLVAVLLALIMCVSSSGGISIMPAEPGTGIVDVDPDSPGLLTPAESGYFNRDVWRADVDFSELSYISYDLEDLKDYTDPIYEMAENGASQEEFEDAFFALYDEIYYIYTLYEIIDERSYADASDTEAAQEAVKAADTYSRAYDEYMLAMRAVAESENSALIEEVYGQDFTEYFKTYEPSTDEDLELGSRESTLVQQYYTLIGEPEVDFEAVGETFLELVELRNRQAKLAGFDSYAEFAYSGVYSKDYTPQDAETVWQGAKEYFAPLLAELGESAVEIADELSAPGTLDASPESVLGALGRGVSQISPELREAYDYMMEHGLYDISIDSSKVNTGYTSLLYYFNEPYIFNCATGTFVDYTDTFHEFGHFANYYYTTADLLFGIQDYDLSELQSQGMEVLFTFMYDQFFEPEIADAMRDYTLLDLAYSVLEGALYDEFLQRVYSEENLTVERVNEIYAELYEEYGYVPYEGYETEWMYVSHNFEAPFYYISYAVSALAALEINELCLEDWDEGVDRYLTVEAMDPEVYYYSEALDEAGFSDIFDIRSYESIAAALGEAVEN